MSASPAPDLAERLTATGELGDALRDLLEASCLTEMPAQDLRAVAGIVRTATEALRVRHREPGQLSTVEDIETGARVFNPVIGHGNGIAPPCDFVREPGGGIAAEFVLRQQYEGPAFHVHGGVTALLIDQLFGRAAIDEGRWGMTAGFELQYRAATPLYTPLRLFGRVTRVEGRKTYLEASIALAAAPDTPLVTATGLLITPSEEKQQLYFGENRPFRKMTD
jgi:acyl-coenzyme A thioesterase PaaI-like protein